MTPKKAKKPRTWAARVWMHVVTPTRNGSLRWLTDTDLLETEANTGIAHGRIEYANVIELTPAMRAALKAKGLL